MLTRPALAVVAVFLTCASASVAQQPPPGPIPDPIPHGPFTVELQPVASGLTSPVVLKTAPQDASRLFVVEQPGQIKIIQNGVVQPTPFLDVSAAGLVPMRSGYDERGLLGLTFDPNFNTPATPGFRRVFTWESDTTVANPDYPLTTPGTVDHQDVLSSWKVSANNSNVIDPASRTVLLRIDHPSFNHDAGQIAFGPDGFLYFGDGDGGGANDTGNGHNPTTGNGQDVNTPLGKIMRIDVNGTNGKNPNYGIPADNPFAGGGGVKEIYATGFRNPYRFSFDGTRLIVADVGQNNIEEVDDVAKGGNYAWNLKEGTFKFNPSNGTVSSDLSGLPPGLIDPLAEYDHDEGIAIVGGFVYHGSRMPWLDGKYIFGDFSKSFTTPSGRIFYADLGTGSIREFALANGDLPLGKFVKGMGIDGDGEIYLLTSTVLAPTGTSGEVFKLVPEPGSLAMAGASMALMLGGRRRKRAG